MKKLLLMAALAAGTSLGFSACTNPNPAMQDAIAQPLQISFADWWLSQKLHVTVLEPMRAGAGQAKIVVQVRNLTDSTINADYKYYFVDDRGVQVDTPSGWQLVKVPPKDTVQFDFTSLSAAARDFRVILRPAQ